MVRDSEASKVSLLWYQPASPILVHNDSDLYSSTLFCLTTLNRFIVSGTIIIFDEFYDALHEYRALCDYCEAFQRSYKIVAATRQFNQVAIQFS